MNDKVLKTLEFDKILLKLSLFSSSEAGAGLCKSLLPDTDIEKIRTAQIQTSDAVLRLRKKAAPSFNSLKDIRPSVKRLDIGATLSCAELLEIAGVLDASESAKKFLKPENTDSASDSLSIFYESLNPCSFLSSEIRRCILSVDEIADDASAALKDIRRRKNIIKDQIQRTLNRLITSQSMKTYLQDSVVTMRDGRYCIPVKSEHKAHVSGMIHDQSGSGSTVFIEPAAVVNLNNDYKELELGEAAEIQVILANLSVQTSMNEKDILLDYRILVELDFILAKGRFSEKIHGNAPDFNDNGIIDLKQARHPLIDPEKVVPINVNLGKDFDMLVVTGPNTGGKTVSLKTVGLLCLMGQAGLHIPAFDGSSLCVFNEIFADIGDEQSIEQSLSTFSSHMKNIVRILDAADSDSLVLLDELCSGTDPTEGAALAESILTRLHLFGSKVMATTHYPELKVFAISTDGVQNACCEFDIETLRPTYKLLIGLPGKSNAFAISGKLGLDERIIAEAKQRIDTENIAFEDLLATIESDKKTAELERSKADRIIRDANELKRSLELEKEDFDRRKKNILRNANEEAYEVLKQAKEYADIAIKDIRKAEKGTVNLAQLEKTRAEIGRKAKASLEKIDDANKISGDAKILKPEEIKKGSCVYVRSINMNGVILDIPDTKGNVPVQVGSMNIKVKASDLQAARLDSMAGALNAGLSKKAVKNKNLQKSSIGSLKYEKALGISTEIKLLGLTVDDALLELSKYIDDASMAHLEKIRIVHGKGTGALRDAVTHYLKKEKRVKKFYIAEYGDGDAGVTYAELK